MSEVRVSGNVPAPPSPTGARYSPARLVVCALVSLLVAAVVPDAYLIPLVGGGSVLFLAILGALAARIGGAGTMMGAIRVTFWGALAMAVTAGIGSLFGTVV